MNRYQRLINLLIKVALVLALAMLMAAGTPRLFWLSALAVLSMPLVLFSRRSSSALRLTVQLLQ